MINWKGEKESISIPQMVVRLNAAEQKLAAQNETAIVANREFQLQHGIHEMAQAVENVEHELAMAHDELSVLRRENARLKNSWCQKLKQFVTGNNS